MKLYRIAKSLYIRDFSGAGARLYGGRWNEKGMPVIYASESISLAALEFLVHVPLVLAPNDLSVCTFDLPDEASINRLRNSALPKNWRASPPLPETIQIGAKWLAAGRTLLLAVPSVVVPDETNYLINPQHREFGKVRKKIKPFQFDSRLINKP